MPKAKYVVADSRSLPNVLKILELIVESIKKPGKKKRFRDFYSLSSREIKPSKIRTFYKKCCKLTTECIQSHRFEEAARFLWIISQEKSIFDHYFYKAAMVVLENLDLNGKNEIIWKFVNHLQNLKLLNKKEVQLEYIMYGLKNNVPDLQRLSDELITKRKTNRLRKNDRLDPILDAYCGLFDYIDWCKSCNGHLSSELGDAAAEKAIVNFSNIIKQAGQWDIFVLKLVEMLHHYDRSEDVESVLLKYTQVNPKHVNAHIYLCVYLHSYNPNSPLLVKHLEIIAQLCSSDIRVLLLVEIWNELGKKRKKSIKYLFMFLDYPSNERNLKAWQLCLDVLVQAVSNDKPSALKVIQSSWDMRRASWSYLYFNLPKFYEQCDSNYDLLVLKVKVLQILEPDHSFVQEAFKTFLNSETASMSLNECFFPPNTLKDENLEVMDFSLI